MKGVARPLRRCAAPNAERVLARLRDAPGQCVDRGALIAAIYPDGVTRTTSADYALAHAVMWLRGHGATITNRKGLGYVLQVEAGPT